MDSNGGRSAPVGDFGAHEKLREKHRICPCSVQPARIAVLGELAPAWEAIVHISS